MSWLTPPSAELVMPGEMPAAAASADMLATNVGKSPPQRAAKEGVERTSVVRMDAEERTKRTLFMTNHFLPEGRPVKAVARSLIAVLPQQEMHCAFPSHLGESQVACARYSPTPQHPAPTRQSPRFRGAASRAQHQNRSARSAHHLHEYPREICGI